MADGSAPTLERSPAMGLVQELVDVVGRERAHQFVDFACDQMTTIELAALAYDWRGTWARPKQVYPDRAWRRGGFLCGRGFGKTRANSEFVNEEVREGRATLIGLAAQDEGNSIDLQVLGPDGLIATAPPWFKPEWLASQMQLVWPNGARAVVRTPEVPGKIRGWSYDLAWLIELQSWPRATMIEAMSNFRISTRLGRARIVWDATPKKRHPLLVELLAEGESDPETNVVIRGTTHENAVNLGEGYVEDLEKKYGGTHKGREELGGEMLDDAEHAIAKAEWIRVARRNAPDRYLRRGIGIDPAVTTRASSDRTGIIDAGVGVDGQGYVIEDLSGKHAAPVWGTLVLDHYVKTHADFVVVETNKGGDLVSANLKAAAERKKLTVIVVGPEEITHHADGIVYLVEVYSKGEKADRAQPLSTAYQAGRISHVIGSDLSSLETTLTTWEPLPGTRSPDDLDALTHVMYKLLGITAVDVDNRRGFEGLEAMRAALADSSGRQIATPGDQAFADVLRSLVSGRGGGGRI